MGPPPPGFNGPPGMMGPPGMVSNVIMKMFENLNSELT